MNRQRKETRKRTLLQYGYIINRLRNSKHEHAPFLLERFIALMEGEIPEVSAGPRVDFWYGFRKPSFEVKKLAEKLAKRYLNPVAVEGGGLVTYGIDLPKESPMPISTRAPNGTITVTLSSSGASR